MLKSIGLLIFAASLSAEANVIADPIGNLLRDSVAYDDPASCGANQLSLEKKLTKVPDVFRLPRPATTNELSRTCVNYILRNGGYTYAKCDSRSGQPVYMGMGSEYRSCVTSNYFNSIYNTYTDIMDCLDIDPRLLLPKLFVESGLHMNSFNRTGFDSGIGQLTTPAIEDVLSDGFDIRTGRIKDSPKASCQRIAAIPGIFNVVSSDKSKRCEFIDAGINPARNMMFTGLYTLVLKKRVTARMETSEIAEKLTAAGMTNADQDKLVQMLSLLAYNVGPSTAVTYLETYLDARIAKIKAKKGTAVKDADFNAVFSALEDFEIFKDVNKMYASNKAYGDKLLAKLGVQNVSFSRFMIYVQDIGGRGYLTHLARMKKKLDTDTETNLCSTEDFLKL